ncbi:MAG: magnesium transporter [Lachnospiraceae bacterium]|nr:magnesium transporter [Lachnospiraceae bacterium]
MNTIKKISSKEILNLLDNREFFSIKNSLNEMNGVDIATLFSTIPTEQLLLLYRLLKKDLAAETFVGMSPETQKELIQGFSDQDLEILLTEIYADDLADILEELPAGVVSKIISKADPDMRKDINLLLNYPEDSAGAIMTTEFISMSRNTMVSDAFEWIRTHGDDRKDVYTCYITDENRKLQGITTVREMLLQKNNIQISEIMDTNVISVNTHDDREDAARIFDKYNLHVLPVTDSENRLVGIITSDDVIDVIQEEVTEDFESVFWSALYWQSQMEFVL